MTVQAFPVRFAETVNRFGAAAVERVGASTPEGDPVLVTLGDRTFVARAHGHRVTRRGRQTLVAVHGRLTWVSGSRVEPLGDPAASDGPATGDPA
jgi:hypothetical protein